MSRVGVRGALASARSRAGLLEISMGAVLLSALLATLAGAFRSTLGLRPASEPLAELLREGARAREAIASELRRSGCTVVNGIAYPRILGGDGSRERHPGIAFVLPADDDRDGHPDLDAEGRLLWDTDEVSYVVVPDMRAGGAGAEGQDASGCLQRRVNGSAGEILARNIEGVSFEGVGERPSGSAGVIRARIRLRAEDGEGKPLRHEEELVVRLWNGRR